MPSLDLDQLFAIAEAAPALDAVEAALRRDGHEAEADALSKLQEDAGVQIDREMTGYDPEAPAPGPETARLNAAFAPVTVERLSILRVAQAKLDDPALEDTISGLLKTLKADVAPAPAPKRGQSPAI